MASYIRRYISGGTSKISKVSELKNSVPGPIRGRDIGNDFRVSEIAFEMGLLNTRIPSI